LFNAIQPVISLYQKFLITSMMSTDWILVRVSNERRFEFLTANREYLPYDASMAQIERLQLNRRRRLDALVIAFGGAVEETRVAEGVHAERAKRSRK